MTRGDLADLFGGVGALLFVGSFVVVMAYAGPEPFFEYRRLDAILFIGGISAAIALWVAWSVTLIGAVLLRAFRPWALLGLPVAAVSIFYLQLGVRGYLDDLEQFMLAAPLNVAHE